MKKIIVLCLVMFKMSFAEEKAREWLKKVHEKFDSYQDIKIDFEYIIDNPKKLDQRIEHGYILFKKENYHAYVSDVEQIFDGSHVYTIMNKDKEVNINSPNDAKFVTPKKILNSYDKDYKLSRDIEQVTVQGKVKYVKLTPNVKDKKVKYILIGILEKDFSIHKIIEVYHNETTSTLKINKLITNQNLEENIFKFDSQKYEKLNYLINDLNF